MIRYFRANTPLYMDIIEVNTKSDKREFLEVAYRINKSFPNYVRPLDKDIEETFNPNTNKEFQHGKATRWILKKEGQTIGRVAAFINDKYKNNGTDYLTGGVGFFECIDDQHAANLLFDEAGKWLKSRGMVAMDGPINFGDRDKWWGLLVDGFDDEPIYGMAFNPPYYQKLVEGYGFQNYYNQYYYAMSIHDEPPIKYKERHARFLTKPEYTARHIQLKDIEKHAAEFAAVYNAAWSQHQEGKETQATDMVKVFTKMKPIIDEHIIWFAYYKDQPIAMWINIPDLNQYFKYFNGRFGLIEKLRLLWLKKSGACKRFTGIAFGVVPKFQALGIDAFIICEGSEFLKKDGLYERYEMGWTGDWNPRMLNIYKALGGNQSRQLVTYRYLLDPSIKFERHPVMDYSIK